MTLADKENEYKLMERSVKGPIRVEIPNGPTITCAGWDLVTSLNKKSFKTLQNPMVSHPQLLIEEINLNPITAKTIYKITFIRKYK